MKEDTESDEYKRKLFEEQESLECQILELQNTQIDVYTETDETDCEVMNGIEDNPDEAVLDSGVNEIVVFSEDDNMSTELRY